MKTDLKVGFQAAIHNAKDTTHAGHATQVKKLQRTQCTHKKNATHTRKESVACIVFFGFLIVLQAVCPLCCIQQLGNRM